MVKPKVEPGIDAVPTPSSTRNARGVIAARAANLRRAHTGQQATPSPSPSPLLAMPRADSPATVRYPEPDESDLFGSEPEHTSCADDQDNVETGSTFNDLIDEFVKDAETMLDKAPTSSAKAKDTEKSGQPDGEAHDGDRGDNGDGDNQKATGDEPSTADGKGSGEDKVRGRNRKEKTPLEKAAHARFMRFSRSITST